MNNDNIQLLKSNIEKKVFSMCGHRTSDTYPLLLKMESIELVWLILKTLDELDIDVKIIKDMNPRLITVNYIVDYISNKVNNNSVP